MTDSNVDAYTPEMILDMDLKSGPYSEEGIILQKLIHNPIGIDIGPLMPCIEVRIKTAKGGIDLFAQLYVDDLPRLNAVISNPACDVNYPFDLISRRLMKSHNTWTQNFERLVKGKNPCTLEVHPFDAETFGITKGQLVNISSIVGEV